MVNCISEIGIHFEEWNYQQNCKFYPPVGSNIIVVLDFKVSYLLGSSLNFLIVNYFLFADKNIMFMPKKLTIKQP